MIIAISLASSGAEALPEWREADVWFRGPVDFGTQLRKDFVGAGLPTGAFHQKLFHLR